MKNLYIVMPAYNEEDNIESVLKAWYPILEGKGADSKIVIADSGSVDKTHEILVAMKKEYPRLEILTDTAKEHGPKLISLYKYAIAHNADYIFQTDSDGQTNPEEFEKFWRMREEYDVILGNRSVREDGKVRAFVEHIVCILLRLHFGVKVPDANAPFRLMKSDIVRKYIYRLPAEYNLTNVMLTTYFSFYHEKLLFLKITFRPRQGGNNSINMIKIIQIGYKALSDFRLFKKDMKKMQ